MNSPEKTKKKTPTRTKTLIIVAVSLTIFTISCMVIQCITGMEVSSTLIDNFFSFMKIEVLTLGGITGTKTITGVIKAKEEIEDTEDDPQE